MQCLIQTNHYKKVMNVTFAVQIPGPTASAKVNQKMQASIHHSKLPSEPQKYQRVYGNMKQQNCGILTLVFCHVIRLQNKVSNPMQEQNGY
jgi:ribonuclease HIII